MRLLLALTTACAALTCALPAAAQFAKPADAIEYRQSTLSVLGTHFGRIGQMVQGRVPFDAKVAAENADIVAVMAKLPWQAFGPGTETGNDTKALPAVWTESDKFKAAADNLQDKAAKLQTAAKSGDLAAIRTAFGETGQSCKACHDNYRAK
jgi:cytochrome c556